MSEFVTWELLGSFAGMVGVVCAVTEILKQYISVDPKWLALAAAFFIVFGNTCIFLRDYTAEGLFLTALNWLIVTGSAIGLFEGIVKPIERKLSGK